MIAVPSHPHRLPEPKGLGAIARVWLSVLFALQLVGVAMGLPHASEKATDLAALSRAVGYSVALCRHGGDGPTRHDDGPGHGDCCQFGLCQPAHQDLVVVPTIVALAPPVRLVRHRTHLAAAIVPTGPLFTGGVSARGPPTLM